MSMRSRVARSGTADTIVLVVDGMDWAV
jgi:hypothetical protein